MTLIAQPEIINHMILKAYITDASADHIDLHIEQLDLLVDRIINDGDDQLIGMYLLDDLEYDIHLLPNASGSVDAYLDVDDEMYWIGTIYPNGEISHLQQVWRLEEIDTTDAHHNHQLETDIIPHISYDDATEYKFTMHKMLDAVRAYLLS